MVGVNRFPRWLEALLDEKFFIPCLVHGFEKKCEKNTFCLDCCISLCTHCLRLHRNHHLLQIRRYVYQDVIRLSDAQKLIDCSSVQPYTTNNAKVVFINPKPTTRQFRWSGNTCVVCHRILQDPYLLCSLSCKVHHMAIDDAEVITNKCMTHESMIELPISQKGTSSNSSSSLTNFTNHNLVCETTTAEFTKKRRSRAIIAKFSEAFNRRKGVPHRSPLN